MILSNRQDVSFSQETIDKVMEIASEIGYTKNNAPFKKRYYFLENTIAVITPNITNPYYSDIIQAIEYAAKIKGYGISIFSVYRSQDETDDLMRKLADSNIVGMIFTKVPTMREEIENIASRIPVVAIGDRNKDVSLNTVGMDNYKAGVLISEHLLGLGHRDIAFISTTLNDDNPIRLQRLRGISDTIARLGSSARLRVSSKNITPLEEMSNPDIEYATGKNLAREFLFDSPITAFIAVNDMVAFGVMDCILENGFQIPKDFSLCGFDNEMASSFRRISLTTVDHYIIDKGANAFEIIYNQINSLKDSDGKQKSITRVEYQYNLIIRDSTGVPPQMK